jgi:hypothetical protein
VRESSVIGVVRKMSVAGCQLLKKGRRKSSLSP